MNWQLFHYQREVEEGEFIQIHFCALKNANSQTDACEG